MPPQHDGLGFRGLGRRGLGSDSSNLLFRGNGGGGGGS